ncbi:MAG: immune inhibitor A [Flexilinea sp.]|nr:immune inhibitor A [Flexilinea sp.]
MKRTRACFYLLFLLIFLRPVHSAAAFSDPLPMDSGVTARFFGDLDRDLPPLMTEPPLWESGMERDFSVLDVSTGTMTGCTARIFLITDSIVFWIDTAFQGEIPDSVEEELRTFDTDLLPILRETFGEEACPGVDNDPRFHVLFTDRIGDGYNGYYSAEDSADPRLRPNSNGMELVFLHTKLIGQGPLAVIDTLAHEFQHMVHHAHDPNEMSFINEGFSGLAEYTAAGYVREPFLRAYLNDTGKSLIWWPDSGNTTPYYGSSFLFSVWLYDRFGPELIRAVTAAGGNGLSGLDEALPELRIGLSADEVFLQWAAALLGQLLQAPVRDLNYSGYAFPQDGITRDIRSLSVPVSEMHEVAQYGLRLYRTESGTPVRISVAGDRESPVTALTVPGGQSAWWSGAESNSLAYLRRDFDLTGTGGEITFEYDVCFDIETDYDYYYLLIEDGAGKIIRLAPSTVTERDPAGQNMGNGSTGSSGGVLHEAVDLNPWAGQRVTLTFVYLTDTAGIRDGLLLDNFRISAIGFSDDAESSDGGWDAAGFRRIGSVLPQRYALVLLHPEEDGSSSAEFFVFDGGEALSADCPEGGCAFAVSAVTREIRSRAAFTVRTEALPEKEP